MTDAEDRAAALIHDAAETAGVLLTKDRRRFERTIYGWLLAVSVGLSIAMYVAFSERARQNERDAAASASAKTLCERSLLFAPALGAFFERTHALDASQLAAYRELLPQSC